MIMAVRQNVPLARHFRSERERLGRVVTVFGVPGGGTTTAAINVAAALTQGGSREVCLVDLALTSGDVAKALQLAPTRSIGDALPRAGSLDLSDAARLVTRYAASLSLLLAPANEPTADNRQRPSLAGPPGRDR